jgi:adenine-specific DNA-methyltransferase
VLRRGPKFKNALFNSAFLVSGLAEFSMKKREKKSPMHDKPISDMLALLCFGNKLHPTQKPLSALLPLIQAFSRPADLVLDSYAGFGSTLVAARQLGRRFLGIEIDAAYRVVAKVRLQATY